MQDLPKTKTSDVYQSLCVRMAPSYIETREQYHLAKDMILALMALLRDKHIADEDAAEASRYMRVVAFFIDHYEQEQFPVARGTGIDALKYLIEANGLHQGSFEAEIGPQPVVSRILRGERKLTREHIEKLAKRFNVTPAVFF